MLVNNFASEKLITIKMANKIFGFLCQFKEFLFFGNFSILSMTLQKKIIGSYVTVCK